MTVWMLDHDPCEAARAHCDQHVKSCPLTYAQTLADCWHDLHNQERAPFGSEEATPWFTRRSYPARSAQDPGAGLYKPRKSAFPGEYPDAYWMLAGQRVPTHRGSLPGPDDEWVRATGGNYVWLWSLSLALCAEHRTRFGGRHPAAPAVWTLELVPMSLRPTQGEWSESPLTMPHHMRVEADGYYDTVASNRRYYNLKLPPQAWAQSAAPQWYEQESGLSIDDQQT